VYKQILINSQLKTETGFKKTELPRSPSSRRRSAVDCSAI